MTVGQLLAGTSSRELTEWIVYERLYGRLDGERGDYQAALVAQTIANSNRGKRGRKHKLTDFLLQWSKQKQSPQEQLSILRSWAARLGGREVRRDGDDR